MSLTVMLTLVNIPDILLVVMLLGLTLIFVPKFLRKRKKRTIREVMVEKQLAKAVDELSAKVDEALDKEKKRSKNPDE